MVGAGWKEDERWQQHTNGAVYHYPKLSLNVGFCFNF